MISTGDSNFDAILTRVDEIKREQGLSRPAPSRPADFSIDLGDLRMKVTFTPISATEKAA